MFYSFLVLFHSIVSCSIITSSHGLPFAVINENKNILAVGDLKTWILWSDSTYEEERYSVTYLNSSRGAQGVQFEGLERFSGGIASQTSHSNVKAIACSQIDTKLYIPERSLAFPNGKWIVDTKLNAFNGLERQCAMLKDGTIGIFFSQSKDILLIHDTFMDDTIQFHVEGVDGDQFEWISTGDTFLLLSNHGKAIVNILLEMNSHSLNVHSMLFKMKRKIGIFLNHLFIPFHLIHTVLQLSALQHQIQVQ